MAVPALGTALIASPAHAQCRYRVVLPATLPCVGFNGRATAISDNGIVTGYGGNGQGCGGAFIWRPSAPPGEDGLVLVPTPPGWSEMLGFGVNDDGVVVGSAQIAGVGHRGFMWDGKTVTVLGVLPGDAVSDADAISNAGISVGNSTNPVGTSGIHAVKWDSGSVTDLDVPLGLWRKALDVNDAGTIVGEMGPGWPLEVNGFIWKIGKAIDLGPIPGGIGSHAVAINQRGEVAVYGDLIGSTLQFRHMRSYIWRDGVLEDMGDGLPPLYTSVQIFDLNDKGDAVGIACDPAVQFGSCVAFTWTKGQFTQVFQHLVEDSEVFCLSANAIDQAGRIAGDVCVENGLILPALIVPVAPVPGDVTCDEVINIDDYTEIILNWGPHIGLPDIDGDGEVGANDLTEVINNWSTS